jgi:hypothetical protein
MMIDGVWISPPMVPELCRDLGVHRTTITRWMKQRRLPNAIRKLLDITGNGALEHIHADWQGWKIDPKDGDLIFPLGEGARRMTITNREIMLMPIRYQQVSALTHKADELAARVADQDRKIRELTERCEAQAARIEELETVLAGYTAGSVVALPRR